MAEDANQKKVWNVGLWSRGVLNLCRSRQAWGNTIILYSPVEDKPKAKPQMPRRTGMYGSHELILIKEKGI